MSTEVLRIKLLARACLEASAQRPVIPVDVLASCTLVRHRGMVQDGQSLGWRPTARLRSTLVMKTDRGGLMALDARVDWRLGGEYFENSLLDYDCACN